MQPANGNANPSNARAAFCPSCGSADVEASFLTGGEARCNVCNWAGKVEELAIFLFSQDMGTTEEVFHAFYLDVRDMLGASFAEHIARMLIKWGFLEQPTAKNKKEVVKLLARYCAAAATAMTKSLIETRRTLEKERCGDKPCA